MKNTLSEWHFEIIVDILSCVVTERQALILGQNLRYISCKNTFSRIPLLEVLEQLS